tara:strand:- start:403 stop:681 length:279 start_codon:yes stop_codon:yes gene_type:complete
MPKLFDLAKKNIKKDDVTKALEVLQDAVDDNAMAFSNDLHAAKKAVKLAEKRVTALDSDATATASSIITAQRELLVAVKNVEDITSIIANRF